LATGRGVQLLKLTANCVLVSGVSMSAEKPRKSPQPMLQPLASIVRRGGPDTGGRRRILVRLLAFG
jgi:hypothetical protein